uniref:phenylalanine--tRNA ligase n=1 Tax=Titanophycus setchellii TaxID=940129 RepID=A0A1G4NYF3_9FLOR|nr:Phenylalanine-tRNA ligase beta subunit [Titanophycus setchellii]SCW23688.1 Phenylalanine-tRNA ligase beta subunit [Titanophycus setchellii]
MNISWHWLGQLVDINNTTPAKLSNKLTLAGFELENIKKDVDNDDNILHISSTANRSDTNYFVGIAQEISSILQCELNLSHIQSNIPIVKKSIICNHSYQEHYITSVIDEVTITESPQWLQKRLALYDITSINNLCDIINFIQLKWGQTIQVLKINEESKETTVKQLQDLKINRNIRNKSISTNKDQWKNNTNIILQLSAYEDGIKEKIVRHNQFPKTTKNFKLSSSDVSNQYKMEAYIEAIILINKLCQAKQPDTIIYISTHKQIKHPISFSYNKNNKILGPVLSYIDKSRRTYIGPNKIDDLFHQLSYITHNHINACYVEIPSYRLEDITREVDLIEEISRLQGFNHFVDTLPKSTSQGHQSIYKYRINQIRSICRSMGLHEVIHTSIGSQYNTTIHNPLSVEYSSIRNELLSKLIQSVKYNIKQTKQTLDIFEIGRIFISREAQYNEVTHIAGILGGNKYIRNQWDSKPQNITWFQAKGDLEELFERININIIWQPSSINDTLTYCTFNESKHYFKKHQYAILHSERGEPIGLFGEINITDNSIQNTEKLYGFEINIESLINIKVHKSFHQFTPYTKYPSIIRDIKIDVPKNWPMAQILENLHIMNEPIIESIELFDVYINKKHKSLGFRITYSNPNSTLTTKEVNTIEKKFKNIYIQS